MVYVCIDAQQQVLYDEPFFLFGKVKRQDPGFRDAGKQGGFII